MQLTSTIPFHWPTRMQNIGEAIARRWRMVWQSKKSSSESGAFAAKTNNGSKATTREITGKPPQNPDGAPRPLEIHKATVDEAMRECDAHWQRLQFELDVILRPEHYESTGIHPRDGKILALLITSLKRLQDGRRQALLLARATPVDEIEDSPKVAEVLAQLRALGIEPDEDEDEEF